MSNKAEPGTTLTFEGISYLRPTTVRRDANTIHVTDAATGEVHNLTYEEHATFWAWAAIEVLRHTGIRIEELHELNHHSFVQYRLPTTGELIPLLQVAPSKTDTERLLLISPELADVLSTIVSRVRRADGAIPLVSAYDTHERVWNPPLPLLFQYKLGTEDRPVTGTERDNSPGWSDGRPECAMAPCRPGRRRGPSLSLAGSRTAAGETAWRQSAAARQVAPREAETSRAVRRARRGRRPGGQRPPARRAPGRADR
ncbi:hypothetical protein [Streptomyces sp. NPDC050121]|uniref:hypothetical protein n=1 Tax=Streptomyces sp. NPDC050121 TaxID=3365601 RepID=UPI003789A0FE